MKKAVSFLLFILWLGAIHAEDGYRLWLRYDPISDKALLQRYRSALGNIRFPGSGTPILATAKQELLTGLQGLLGQSPASPASGSPGIANTLIVGTAATSSLINQLHWQNDLSRLGPEI